LTKKIGLIGRLDPECELFDGQTVKTRMMHRLLCGLYGEGNVIVVDTKDYRRNAARVAVQAVRCLLTCGDVFVSLSRNGRKAFFPLLSFAARHLHTRVYHNLIGGWLANDLRERPEQVNYLNDFRVNWVESRQLVGKLEELGVNNAEFLPNFKYLDEMKFPETRHYGPSYRFCTFSRVQELKGISDAIETVGKLCSRGYDCHLDVYGPIDPGYKDEFETALARCAYADYRGCVAPEESVRAIAGYDALLFPTKWKPEGIPGTIIDALSAGVPVIAAKWQYYDEMLEDGVTGFGYEFGDNGLLADEIERFIALGDGANALRKGCLVRAGAYSPEVVSEVVAAAVDDER
jgi:glycosyltransferase involved in cell wall biosynthesis